ncbi:hypothetical protein ENVG_00325 [Emiliania huxleyi virus 84]|nr:hypothetical protein ENVG_00325 [Emiliania huxleyi virus 84]
MEYKIIIIIIQSVLLFVIFSVLLYLLFGRGQAFMPPIDETTLTLLDTFKMTNNLGIFESLYGEDMSLDEKQVAVADAYNLLDYHASMIKNSPNSNDERKLYRINHLKSMFDATNDVLRHSQIQSRGLDRPVVRNIAFAASKLTDWLRTVPESKYPSEGISREIYNEFDLAEKRRMQTEIQREESIALELERNNKIADEWIRQHPDEMQKLRERQKRDEIAKKVKTANKKRRK